jgi:DNA transformation protein
MPISNEEREFVAYVVDLMQSLGPVSAKRMFGGHGIFVEGLMFGLVADGVLYLKVDEQSLPEFEARGLSAFTYDKRGTQYRMSYYQAPDEALDNAEEMALWARRGCSAALRAAARKPNK